MDLSDLYEFDLNGFIIRRGLLAASEVAALRTHVGTPDVATRTGKFSFFERHPCFTDLMARRETLEIMRELCGEWFRFDHAFGLQMTNAVPAWQGLHGGHRASHGAFAYEFRNGRIHNGLVKAIYALSDVNSGDGGFICIPGSHKANVEYRPSSTSPLVVNPAMKAGDMLVFTEALVHGSRQWKAVEPRVALVYSYAPGCLAWRAEHTTSGYWKHVTTDVQRDLLRPPSVGEYEEDSRSTDRHWPATRRNPTRIA